MRYHSISVDQARYDNSIVDKYLDTSTVKTSTKFYKKILPSDMIFTKNDVYTSNEQVEKFFREFNINYRSCIGSLIYLLSTRLHLSFAVHKLANSSSNTGKVHFEELIYLLRYIGNNKYFSFKYYADMKDATLYYLLRQDIIKTENQLMVSLILFDNIV